MFEGLNVTKSVKERIENAVKASKLSHALILEGSDETTREAVAREIAAAVLCKGEDKPCGNCPSCHKIKSGNHPDLHILKKDEGSAMIKVDSVRQIKSKAQVYPNDGDKSVFIICEAQYMNPQAQNALLKIFEEPSEHVRFILTCGSKSSLLDTVISRGTAYLLSEEVSADESSEANAAARDKASELLISLCCESELEFLRKTAVFQKDKPLFKATLEQTVPILRDILVLQSGGKAMVSGCDTTVRKLKGLMTQRQTAALIEAVTQLIGCTLSSGNHNLLITRFSAVLHSIMKG